MSLIGMKTQLPTSNPDAELKEEFIPYLKRGWNLSEDEIKDYKRLRKRSLKIYNIIKKTGECYTPDSYGSYQDIFFGDDGYAIDFFLGKEEILQYIIDVEEKLGFYKKIYGTTDPPFHCDLEAVYYGEKDITLFC